MAPESISIEEKLQERIKELSCLYQVSSAIREFDGSYEATLESIVQILKNAWRFPELATVEIKCESYHLSSNPIPSEGYSQKSIIKISEKEIGFIKVHYPASDLSKAHFLVEEQRLLDKIADEIALFFERQNIKVQEELLKQTAERNDRLSILGEITAGIAHELNTPLGNILGFAEFIEEKTKESQTKRDAQKILNSAIYSREVVKKLMFFSCDMPQDIKKIEVKPVITQALSLLKPNFKKANIRFKFNIQDPALKAQVDSIQLTQVFFNLVINAIYYSPQNSQIVISIFNDDTHYTIEIADEGKGINPEVKEKIFEPFYTTKPLGEGSGLGLSVVHGIIKSHKGEISIADNFPKGTIFKIKLPLNF
ncbi:HAMP domain-containing histidine kinase [Salegentibacter sp. LM13S]|uniref:sensor histidine kinase n=1 Tax=Salegentibacter lacus TaxID=2873599 RepID=UPI001CCD95DF|nr:HAMP domain-containing sensor histidine kinase [Salegentibacter lacus]MBZ9630822.1 HAMP domain-containing histidine kinase [Salegentibacter lacus]